MNQCQMVLAALITSDSNFGDRPHIFPTNFLSSRVKYIFLCGSSFKRLQFTNSFEKLRIRLSLIVMSNVLRSI